MNLFKRILFLILIFFVLDFLISTTLLKLVEASKIRFSRLYHEKIDSEIIFIGNSRAINSFYSPYFDEISNLKSINLAYNGVSISLVKVFLEDYLERNDPPIIIVIEVTCIKEDNSGLPNFRQYIPYSKELRKIVKEHYPKVYYTSHISKSYYYNSEYFLRTLYYLKKNDQSWINRYTINQNYYNSLKVDDSFTMVDKIDKNSMQLFKAIVKNCNERGITIIPVLAPIIDKYRNDTKINNYIADFESKSQMKLVDFSKEINDINMFADEIHTNDKGANILANKLLVLPEFVSCIRSKKSGR
ncbi:MAG: hypothetical protein K8S23_04140 [Candidatus Cloacimonetes bacterium]|nr:hypothetical protein [Candidatus Cloacimonadota bacterium]